MSAPSGSRLLQRRPGMTATKLLAAFTMASLLVLAAPGRADASGDSVCTGTVASPGTLAGTYASNVTINGVCFVNGGPATVQRNLTITPGSALIAAFGLNDQTGTGNSSLTVNGNLVVESGAALVMGCEPNFFPCFDDPSGTLTSAGTVGKNLTAFGALGILVHASTIGRNVTELGGGGGLSCVPSGIFAAFFSPVYSDFEDNVIGRNLTVAGLQTCWLGALRNQVTRNLTALGNKTADPDGNEVVSNTVGRNIACFANAPAVQFGDSRGISNVVGRNAFGECGFDVLVPNPEPSGPLTPISVRAG